MRLYLLIVFLLGCLYFASGLENGLGRTPPMGWNSWYVFYCGVTEDKMKQAIDAMVTYDLRKYGYEYALIDDCWSIGRDKNGVMLPDSTAFPSGIPALSDYAHSRGFKLGIYSDSGSATCMGRPGSYGYEEIDAKTFASWKVDFLKYDNCHVNDSMGTTQSRYARMTKALSMVDRPIFYSMCDWGVDAPWSWGMETGNSWRVSWDLMDNPFALVTVIDSYVGTSIFAGPGGWNDPDMLRIGTGGMTMEWYRLQFAFWCLLKAPLIMSFNMQRNMTTDILNLITNTELIAINQDKLGIQGDLIWQLGPSQIWAGPLADGGRAFIVWERIIEKDIVVDFSLLGYDNTTTVTVRDVLNGKDMGTYTGKYVVNVSGNEVFFFAGRLTPVNPNPAYTTWRPWHKSPFCN